MDQPDHSERGHSPLGASGAERWMKCAGSVALIAKFREILDALGIPEEDDPDYRREGTAMHEAGEHCLRLGLDTWEIVGQTFNDTVIDTPMADAIQVYLDRCRADMDVAVKYWIEFPISSPVHPKFYGSLDFGALLAKANRIRMDEMGLDPAERLKVRDLKGGEGIVVDPEDNPQLKYYAFGIIDGIERSSAITLRDDLIVDLEIVQPRAFHVEGPIRTWSTTVGEIKAWVHGVLVPAMNNTELDHDLDAGPHCRFCPAKLVCPLLTSLFRAACVANPKEVVNYGNESLARSWAQAKAVKFYLKALEDETFRRLNMGNNKGFDGVVKLVPKKANRVWNTDAKDEAKKKFGGEAFTKPEMKSPAELEKLSPAAKSFVGEYAHHPDTGLTVAAWDDPKPAVKVQTTTEAFGAALRALQETA
jgi:hypothetical protein